MGARWGERRNGGAVRRALVVCALVVGAAAGPAWAQPGVDDQSDVPELQEQYDEAVAQEAQLLDAYDASVARLASISEQIVSLNDSIAAAEADLLSAEQELQVAQDALHVTEVRLAEVEDELDAAERELHDQVVESYIFGGDDASAAAALLQAETLDEYRTTRVYAEAVVEDQDRVVERFIALRDEAESLRRDAAASRDLARSARDDVAARQAALVAERDRYGAVQAEAFLEAAGQEQLIAEVQAQKGEYQLRLAVLQGTSDSITAMLQARQQGQSLPPDTVGIFGRPVPGGVSSGYGPRLHPIFGEVRQHNGLDMAGGMGQPIAASAPGIVVSADSRGGYGNAVVVDHGNALATVYAHMSSFNVYPGDVVERGDVLGGVGSTGFSTGPHLHWEVRVFGVPVDPVPYLER
jgi:murein DD-endopeptidase MepM/ murein hydrolase activator NlpD